MGGYDRGQGNPKPYYPLSGYSRTGNPTQFRPMNSSGNGVQPMNVGRGVQPLGFYIPLVTSLLGLAAIGGATYVANSGVEKALAPETAALIADPIVKTTSSIATTAVVGLIAYLIFKKDIQRILK